MLALLIAYAAAQVALGLWIGRRVRGAGDFFVAGRALGPGLLATTLLAANIGAGSTVGAAGLGYRDGLAAWMEAHEYESITQMQGSMSYRSVREPASFERANYLKVLSSYPYRR